MTREKTTEIKKTSMEMRMMKAREGKRMMITEDLSPECNLVLITSSLELLLTLVR